MKMSKRKKGFTLLEVMLALSIISVSLVGLIRAYVLIDRSEVNSTKYVQALYLQELKLHDIVQEKNLSRLKAEGVFEPPFEQFQWKMSQGSQTRNGFRDVHLTIFWTAYNQTKEISISTYLRKKNGAKKTE